MSRPARNLIRWFEAATVREPSVRKAKARDYLYNYLQVVVLLSCNLYLYHLAAQRMGPDGFSEYTLGRRLLALVNPALSLGVGAAVARAAARAQVGGRRSLLLGGLVLTLALNGVVVVLSVLMPEALSLLFFGDESLAQLMLPLSCANLALAINNLEFHFLVGSMQMGASSLLASFNVGLLQLAAVALAPDVEAVFWMVAAVASVTSTAAFLWSYSQERDRAASRAEVKERCREFLDYSLPRVPGAFAEAALLGLPAVLTAHIDGVRAAGMVAFGGSLLALSAAVVRPVSLVLLPQASRLSERAADAGFRRQFYRLLWVISAVFIGATFLGFAVAERAITAYLGQKFVVYTPILLLMLAGAWPYGIYCALRGLIDGASVRPINAHNTYLSLAGFGLVSGLAWAGSLEYPFIVGLLAGCYVLGLASVVKGRRLLDQSPQSGPAERGGQGGSKGESEPETEQ